MAVRLRFVRRLSEAENIQSFYFESEPALRFRAGQYLMVTLPHMQVDDRGAERAFTIASSPAESLVRLTTRFSRDSSSFKRALMALTPGATLAADGPFGDFVVRDDDGPLVLIAGGIGITPFRSMLADQFASGRRHEITLLYSNSSPDFAFRPFLDALAKCWADLRVVYTVTRPSLGWHGPTGRIGAEFIRDHVRAADLATFYVCGPTPLVNGMRASLAELDVDERRLVHEGFPGYTAVDESVVAAA
jgi:ferredoxin-NADP reductase